MKTILWVSVFAFVLASAGDAQACGQCRRSGHGRSRIHSSSPSHTHRSSASQPPILVSVSPPAAAPAEVRPPQVAPAPTVQPQHTYQATPENGEAYYYTYDDSGNLIVKQWMDWLRPAPGRPPAPPLPIIGHLNN